MSKFLILLLANSIGVLCYLIYGLFLIPLRIVKNSQKKEYSKTEYILKSIIMLLCPIVGPGFFVFGQIFYYILFRNALDLEDVIFSKERVVTYLKADEERGRNIVSLEEAIAVSDKESLRTVMMNVVRGESHNSLSAISLALNSEDSETSHYAASVLTEELNDFRMKVQKEYMQIKDEDMIQSAIMLIEYMNNVLKQKIFTDIEQVHFVLIFEDVCNILYEKNKSEMEIQHYEWICMRLLEIQKFEDVEKWCIRSMEEFPNELSSYTCQMKLYYESFDKERFFQVIRKLKESKIVIDSETLELIRMFS